MEKPVKPIKRWIKFVFFVLIAFLALVVVHEGTHIALNGFRVEGFCFLDCPQIESQDWFGNNNIVNTPIAVGLTEPVNPLAKNEVIPSLTGIFAFLVILFTLFELNYKKTGRAV